MLIERHLHLLAAPVAAIRTAKFDAREHLVVPVVALVEGVIFPVNASTPELVLAEEFSKTPQGWNGRPVVADHPANGDQRVSANDPAVLERDCIGRVFNTKVVDKKLTMEAWIDVEKAGRIAPKMLEKIQDGKMLEVSVGAFVVAEQKEGTYNGKTYKAVWHEIVPDHLALLPEGTLGACSNAMGCGTPRAAMMHVLAGDSIDLLNADDEELEALLEFALQDPDALRSAAFDKHAYMREYNRRKRGSGSGRGSGGSTPPSGGGGSPLPEKFTAPAGGKDLPKVQSSDPKVVREAAKAQKKELLDAGFVQKQALSQTFTPKQMGMSGPQTGGATTKDSFFVHKKSGMSARIQEFYPKKGPSWAITHIEPMSKKRMKNLAASALYGVAELSEAHVDEEALDEFLDFLLEDPDALRAAAFDKHAYMKEYNARKRKGGGGGGGGSAAKGDMGGSDSVGPGTSKAGFTKNIGAHMAAQEPGTSVLTPHPNPHVVASSFDVIRHKDKSFEVKVRSHGDPDHDKVIATGTDPKAVAGKIYDYAMGESYANKQALQREKEHAAKKGKKMKKLAAAITPWRSEMLEFIAAEDLSDMDIRRALDSALRAAVPGYLGVDSVFSSERKVVYAFALDNDGPISLQRRSYDLDEAGEVKLGKDAEDVKPVTKFEAASSETRAAGCGCGGTKDGPSAPSKGADEMSLSQKQERIKRLLASGKTPFVEADLPVLEKTLTDEHIKVLEDAAAAAATPPPAKDDKKVETPAKTLTPEEAEAAYLADAPESIKTIVAEHKARAAARKTQLLATLKAAGQKAFSEDELAAKPVDELEKLATLAAASAPPKPTLVNMSGLGTPADDSSEIPPPPSLADRIRTARAAGQKQ